MKEKIVGLSLMMILLIPGLLCAEYSIPIMVQGTIGDYSKTSRNYEIDGRIYSLPKNISLEDKSGNRISFNKLRSGSVVQILGEKTIGTLEKNPVVFNKIVLVR
jgi:hypothetical protein